MIYDNDTMINTTRSVIDHYTRWPGRSIIYRFKLIVNRWCRSLIVSSPTSRADVRGIPN